MGTILKFVLFAFLGYLAVGIFFAFKQMKKQQDQAMVQYEEKREKFRHVTADLIDATSDEELKEGILLHIFHKEDEDFEHLKENLTAGELVFYTIYQMEIAVDHGRGSVHKFFDTPSKVYASHLVESFKAVNCPKLSTLMANIISLIMQEETGHYHEIDLDEDAPSFQTYTFDYMDLVEEENLEANLIRYIREHKNLFTN